MFRENERIFAEAASGLATANPFRPDKVAAFEETAAKADIPAPRQGHPDIPERPSVGPLVAKATELLTSLESRIPSTDRSKKDIELHAQLVRFVLYFEFRDQLQDSVELGFSNPDSTAVPWFGEFQSRFRKLSLPNGGDDPLAHPGHTLACFFQIRRAYHLIHSQLVGNARPIQELRAAAWDSVFTADMLLYGRVLFDRMHDVSTLIVGPTGTGKEVVARAIGLSRYVPFVERTRQFAEPFTGAFHGISLPALAPTLVESELFGHAKGAFTGATSNREGWFEKCKTGHSVFLDEIGELEPALQVKMLRVLQERTFQRLGETRSRRFEGKVIAATNRRLPDEMAAGRFRADLYYRLCSDVIHTPSLRAQLNDHPDDIDALVAAIAARQTGRGLPDFADKACQYIRKRLVDYPWPGNVRELEQCIRSVLIRGAYRPMTHGGATERERLANRLQHETPTSDQLLTEYCRVLYSELGTYTEVARILGLDRRTVQRRIDS